MNKLQLYINKSLRGFKVVCNINPEEKIQQQIHELRTALENVAYDPAHMNIFYLISYLAEGSLFTILRTIPDKPLDHLATTIFIPNGLQISAQELGEIVKRTTAMVSNAAVTPEDVTELHNLFAKEYPETPDVPAMVASEVGKWAYCLFGGGGRSLDSFFSDGLYQTAYIPYEGVLLVDVAAALTIKGDNLSAVAPANNVALLPPKGDFNGFMPYIFKCHFNRPYLVPLGSTVDITWHRTGFEPRHQKFTVAAPGMELPAIAFDDTHKAVSPASFLITSQSTRERIADAVITVNGVEIKEAHNFTLVELRDADVTVAASGFAPFHAKIDLATTTQALIQLPETPKIYRFELPVSSSELGAPIRFEIHTKRELTESPVEGYELNEAIQEGHGTVNHLSYIGYWEGYDRRTLIIAAACALVVGFLLGWLLTGGSGRDSASAADTVPEIVEVPLTEIAPAPAVTPPQAPVVKSPATSEAKTVTASEAISYLDKSKAWNRPDMEKIPDLKGLFDDLNNYRFDRIIDYWLPRLKASTSFTKVAAAIVNGRSKQKFVPAAGATYCSPGDTSIAVINYMYKVDP